MAAADGTSSTTDVKAFKKGVSDSITSRYAKFSGAVEVSIEPFARHMFEAGLINRTTMRGQNYDDIMSQFISGMDFKHSISELQEHCQLFTDVLEKLGGAAKMAASEFTQEWTTLVPQQQCLVVRSEVDVTKVHSQQVKGIKLNSKCKFPTRELASKAKNLKRAFHILLLAVRNSSKHIDFAEFNFFVQGLLTDDQECFQTVSILKYLGDIDKLTTSSDILLFLKKHGFIGYMNYDILEDIVKCLLKDNLEIVTQMNDYIKKYEEFDLTQNELEEVSQEEDLHPRAPSGLPEFSLRTNGDTSVHQWRKTYSEKFSWSNRTLLKEINPGSIILTYVALPCVVSDILRDLTDPAILRELESMEVTVVHLPQPSQTSELSLSSIVENEHVKDDIKQTQMISDPEEPFLDPVTIKELSLYPIPTKEPLLGPISIKQPSLDPVPTQDPIISSQDNIKIKTLVQDNGQQLVLHSIQYNNTLDEPLITVVRENDVSEVIRLLENGADPNCYDKGFWKETPLHIAVQKGYKIIVSTLLSMKADPNITSNYENRTPLFDAVDSGNVDIVETLLSAGANPNIVSSYRNITPLCVAVEKGSNDIVTTLLLNGADPNITSDDGTPLHIAVINGNDEIIHTLLLNGADPNVTFGHDGKTILHYSAKRGDIDIIKTLLSKGGNPNIKDKYGNTALHKGVDSHNSRVVKELLKRKADPNIVNNEGQTPLHLAAKLFVDIDIIMLLLNYGANPNIVDNVDKSSYKMSEHSTSLVSLQRTMTSDVMELDLPERGRTALHYAVQHGNVDMIKALLDRGCDPNIQDKCGETALHLVMTHSDIIFSNIIQKLLQGGANPDIMNDDGKKPKDMIIDDRWKREFVSISEKYSKFSRDITTVPLSPYDKPSSYSTIHESSKRMISEPTHLIEDPDVSDILEILDSDWRPELTQEPELIKTKKETTRSTSKCHIL